MLENRGGGGGVIFNGHDLFIKIISVSNLFTAWSEFKRDKIKKNDVSSFAVSLEEELFNLHHLLKSDQYKHDKYTAFYVHDPKLRSIHKAKVIDRVFHHALVRIIEPIFDKGFIFDSYSSRKNKGTYEAGKRFRKFAWKISCQNTKTVWILKCDIRKFFDSVDHDILIGLLLQKIKDEKVTKLLIQIIKSFQSQPDKGIPLGNLTSQLFSNVYMNPLDNFIKRNLGVKHYIRYADDFVALSDDRQYLENILDKIDYFLKTELKLNLHPSKVSFVKWHEGIDFLGFVHFPYHSVIRTKTKRRIISKMKIARIKLEKELISPHQYNQILQSYLGRLKHCCSKKICEKLLSDK